MKTQLIIGCLGCLAIGAWAAEVAIPEMKDGLWESRTQRTVQGKKLDVTMKICHSSEAQQSMKATGDEVRKANQCTEVVTQTSPTTYTSESRCAKGVLAGSVTKLVYTLEGDLAYHMEVHSMQGQDDTLTITDSKYLGSCPAGMKPGDVVMADGKKLDGN
jgi:hypothetical protein